MTLRMEPVADESGSTHRMLGHGGPLSPAIAAAAEANLQAAIDKGAARSAEVVRRVLEEVPQDTIASPREFEWFVTSDGIELGIPRRGAAHVVHSNAIGQACERVGLPAAWLRDQAASEDGWRHEEVADMLNNHCRHADESARYLVRSWGGVDRGILSDKYRRLSSPRLLEAALGACQEVGAVAMEAHATDIKWHIRALVPRVDQPVPGELIVWGLDIHHSDYGAGSYGIAPFYHRLMCLNTALENSALKQVHLGARIADDAVFSEQTYELDTQTMCSATSDVIVNVLAPARIAQRLEAVKKAHETETDWAKAYAKVAKLLTKAEARRVHEAFEGPDETMLPGGPSVARFSNALSWIANQTDGVDRKVELQRLAGKVMLPEPKRKAA